MINDNIKTKKTKWCYEEILLKLGCCCWTSTLYEKVERQSEQWWRLCKILTRGERMTPPASSFVGASGTYSRILVIYVVLVSLLLFLSILLNVNNRNTKKMCEIYWQLTVKLPEWLQWPGICVFIINFEYISHIVLVFLLLADIEQVNIDWVKP